VKFAWIQQQQQQQQQQQEERDQLGVSIMCEVLQVSRSGYYAWVNRPPGERARRRAELIGQIRSPHEQSGGTYGSPRVHAELAGAGVGVCVNTVARLMKHAQVRSVMHRRFVVRTTDSRHDHPVAPNVLERDFAAERPDRKWCCDITYIPTREGFLYLAGVMDLCSRRIVGWSMAEHMRTDLCLDALDMALRSRKPGPGAGLVHHSDRGVQYASVDYRRVLQSHGILVSMSGVGDCYDNAAMESFWGTLKTELVHHRDYATREEARQSIFRYIECWYNRRRRHSAIGYKSPEQFEASLN
jgi:putative transposase